MEFELDERVAQELRELYKSQANGGRVLSPEHLAGYYSAFRSRFGPEKLKNLDGEALLDTMYNFGNRDSLVYCWSSRMMRSFPTSLGALLVAAPSSMGCFAKGKQGYGRQVLPAIQ